MYQFNAGTGDVLHDTSGNGHHGNIYGATWVRVGGSPPKKSVIQRPADAPPLAIAPFDAEQAKRHQQAWAKYLGVTVEKKIVVGKDKNGKDVKLTMVLIPPGEFLMGSTQEEIQRIRDEGTWPYGHQLLPYETPRHAVRITRPFLMGRYEVTQGQYEEVVGNNPSLVKFRGQNKPVESVTYAVPFVRDFA